MLVKNNSSWMFLEPLRVSVGSRLVRWWQRIIVLLFDKQKWERAKKKRKKEKYLFRFDSRKMDFSQTQQTKKSQICIWSHFKAVLSSKILTLCDQMQWDIKKTKQMRAVGNELESEKKLHLHTIRHIQIRLRWFLYLISHIYLKLTRRRHVK